MSAPKLDWTIRRDGPVLARVADGECVLMLLNSHLIWRARVLFRSREVWSSLDNDPRDVSELHEELRAVVERIELPQKLATARRMVEWAERSRPESLEHWTAKAALLSARGRELGIVQ